MNTDHFAENYSALALAGRLIQELDRRGVEYTLQTVEVPAPPVRGHRIPAHTELRVIAENTSTAFYGLADGRITAAKDLTDYDTTYLAEFEDSHLWETYVGYILDYATRGLR